MTDTEARHDAGIYFGQFLDNGQPHGEIRYRGPKHLISIGPPGSNKTAGLVIPNISDLPRSMVIIDPKGQIAAITARKRARLGKVVVLNPFGLFAEEPPPYKAPDWSEEHGWRCGQVVETHHMKSHGFNPLTQLDPDSDHFADNAADIAASIVPMEANEHQKHFPEFARDLYSIVFMHERMTKGDAASIAGARRILTATTVYEKRPKIKDPVPVSGFMKTLSDMRDGGFPPIANLAGRILERFNDKASGNTGMQDVIDTAIRATNKLDSPPIARDLSGGTIDFAKFREEITTCYIILPTAELVTHSIWLRLVISSALRALYQTPLPPPEKTLPPVYFLLDEFAALGRLESIQTALGVARDYAIQMHIILQDLNQLRRIYGHDTWETFMTGAGAVSAFAPRDWFTAEHLSRFCGQKTEIIESHNEGQNTQGSNTGRSWQPQGLPLMRPEDLMRMPRGQMICMVEPEPMPFFTTAPPYPFTPYGDGLDENPYFRNRPT